jgi:hypothetical protein
MDLGSPLIPQVEPTLCGTVSDFKELTTSANAITLGWYGFAAGIITAGLFYVAVVYVAPVVYGYGCDKGWWS